jgi:4-hydroxy-tetrahydrodipicolinate reductase
MIKTALIGYGQMGKEIETLSEGKLEITSIFDLASEMSANKNYEFTTALEFTSPAVVFDNIKTLAEYGKNIVCGTTGWDNNVDEVKAIVKSNGIGFVYASNFSIGMRLFFKLAEAAGTLFNDYDDYDVFMHEFHHKRKKDSPSGTAISLGNILLEKINRKKELMTSTSENQIDEASLHVTSTRGGEIPGTHSIYFDSIADTIEIKHQARNRHGFALGAIKAAELVNGRKGFFEFGELLFEQ